MIVPEGQQLEGLDCLACWIRRGGRRFVFGGYAGTGKTSLIPHIRDIKQEKSAVVTYTNMAAGILRDKGISDASTIFRLMYDLIDEENMIWRKRRELPFDRVIVDESSMIGATIRRDLESYGVPILYVGDGFQLPPVGDDEGSVMDHPDFTLTEPHRFAKDSEIIQIATAIREGRRYPDVDKYDVTDEELASYDVVICYTNKTRFNLNQRIRRFRGMGPNPEPGDRVIMAKTDYDYGLFAGECGTILSTNGKWQASVQFDGDLHPVNFMRCRFMQEGENPYGQDLNGRQCLDFAYARTAHKMQGSQAPRVFVWREARSDPRWTYTSVTRAMDHVVVGS